MKIGEETINLIKRVLNYENLIECFVSSIGYGIGYAIPQKYNCNLFVSLIISYVFGILTFELADKLLQIPRYKQSKGKRITLAIVVYLAYLTAWIISYYLFDYDIDEVLILNVIWVIAVSIVGFIFNIYRKYRKMKKA